MAEAVQSHVVDFGNVPSFQDAIPPSLCLVRINSIEQRYSKEKQLLMYVFELRVLAPAEIRGRGHYEYIVIGKKPQDPGDNPDPKWIKYCDIDDPDGTDPLNHELNPSTKQLKRYLQYAGLDVDGPIDMADVANLAVEGKLEVGVRFIQETETEGRYAGSVRNRVTYVFEPGREEYKIEPVKGTATRPAATHQRASQAKPKATVVGSSPVVAGRLAQDRTRAAATDEAAVATADASDDIPF